MSRVTPEDLVEAWHMVVADGAEPMRWKLPQSLWLQVRRAADEHAAIDAGDPLPEEQDRTLLGSPVEVDPREDFAPILYIRRDGNEESVPVFGQAVEHDD